ncbi:MAG: RNA methyltransferase [bacterium]|nr:RNA methyltransferase [bacterium]
MTERRKKLIQEVVGQRQQGILVLEDIHDPHNAAACLRSAEAFGFQQVYFIFAEETKFNPKKVGSVVASSANKWLDYKVFDSTKKCFSELRKKGYEIVTTVVDNSKAESFFKVSLTKSKIALVLGNEHRGVSQEAIRLSDRHLYMPMRGFVESFNLSVFASLCLYEITRQRLGRGMRKYLYSSKERTKLEREFFKRGSK